MNPLVSEQSGDSLGGAINGSNTTFTTSFDYVDAFVQVFLNGVLLYADHANGYTLAPPRGIQMKIAPESLDTLEVAYQADTQAGGGAQSGRCPNAPQLSVLRPTATLDVLKPVILSGDTEDC